MMPPFRYLTVAILWLTTGATTSLAATVPQQVTSPLTGREEALHKHNQAPNIDIQWGGHLLIRAGNPPPLDGAPDDLRVGALELGGNLTLNRRVILHGLLLYEQQITDPPEMDERYLGLRLNDTLRLQIGRQYVPFGNYDTAMINMPLTQYLGETRAEAMSLAVERDTYHMALYAFNTSQTASTVWGINLGRQWGPLEGNLSWMNDLTASGAFTDGQHASGPVALGHHLQWTDRNWVAHLEWIGALDTLPTALALWRGQGAQPQALAAELRLPTKLPRQGDLALSWQHS